MSWRHEACSDAHVLGLIQRASARIHAFPARVATKFAACFLACVTLAMFVYAVLMAFDEAQRIERNARADLASDARLLSVVIGDVWRREGEGRARELLRATEASGVSAAISSDGDTSITVAKNEVASSIELSTPDGARTLTIRRKVPDARAILYDEAIPSFATAGILGLVAVVLCYWLGHFLVGAPLDRVVAQARRIGEGDLSHRLPPTGSLEIARLKAEVNAMCDRIREARERADEESRARVEAVERLRHADRLRTVGTLAAGIAHELGTPLNIVLLRAKRLQRDANVETAEHGRVIGECTARMATIARQLLDFARTKRTAPAAASEVSLGPLLERVGGLLEPLCRTRGVALVIDRASADVRARIDPDELQQVVTNLVVNAVDASPDGATIKLRSFSEAGEPQRACIEVDDEGAGIPDDVKERIFEPFFTTKDVGRGTGLGLAVALGIVEESGGSIRVGRKPSGGTRFTVQLPCA